MLSKIIKNVLIGLSIILLIMIIVLVIINYMINTEMFADYYATANEPYTLPEILDNIVTKEEIDYILDKSKDIFNDSTVVANTGASVVKNARDSKTAWLSKEDPIIHSIMEKVCKKVGKDVKNCEDLQVVKYEPNGYYNNHHDSCCDDSEICNKFKERGGQRVMTCVIYLTDDFEGGETNFPNLNFKAKPPKGSGVLFHPMTDDEKKCHPNALHAGLPVKSGTKIIANVWIRETSI